MSARRLRVFTIAPSADFLDVLTAAILEGFPDSAPPDPFVLARSTILLPTRRAVRAFENRLADRHSAAGLLLPRVRPIGDIDEELFEDHQPTDDLAAPMFDPISPAARELLLVALVDEWAKANPASALAREIAASPRQSLNLAGSLAELVDGLETEDLDVARLPELYDLEQARHREAILNFLSLVRERLPARLLELKLMGPRARRSAILRREAKRLGQAPQRFPVIAAGSTGSIPATRELLLSIAGLDQGAVVLPGLDLVMDEASWANVGEQHPQFALKQTLAQFGLERKDVQLLGPPVGPRDWLASELMRPPATSDAWREIVGGQAAKVVAAVDGMELVAAHDIREEAQIVALMMRKALAAGEIASLVTPDRELARRVKQELANANILVDDSAGEPLIHFGGAALIDLVIEAALQNASAPSLLALFRHPLCRLGLTADAARQAVDVIDVALFRSTPIMPPLAGFAEHLRQAHLDLASDTHAPQLVFRLTPEIWEAATKFAGDVAAALQPLLESRDEPLAAHIDRLLAASTAMSGDNLYDGEEGELLRTLMDALRQDAIHLPYCGTAQALLIVRHYLTATPLRRRREASPQLSILGLLEARLTRSDLVVLGGLNEGVWPALPDAGPWLNRPMRTILGMALPERQIGQTAHDFVQALGCRRCALIWAERLGDAPAVPSRWLLRLQMLLAASEIKLENSWPALARQLLAPAATVPAGKPRPRPPRSARPKRLSVTRIETLIRDPYAIYARHVLRLEPLTEPMAAADFATRGTLFHGIAAEFAARFATALPTDAEREFLAIAERHFRPYREDAEIMGFWWSQIRRIASWLTGEEQALRAGVSAIHVECGGKLDLMVAGEPFALTGRADRIDILADGKARIIDYKSGQVPSSKQVKAGLAPQLTLEAAMLAAGAFQGLGKRETSELLYIRLSGGNPPGEVEAPKLDAPVPEVAQRHLDGLLALLHAYADDNKPYLPRVMIEHEDDVGDYDHLSRFREWALSGGAS